MFTSAQENLIERFNEQVSGLYHKWPEISEVCAPNEVHLDNVYRALYAKLAPDEAPLPESWSYRLTAIAERGDGIQGTGEAFWMPDGQEVRTFELLVKDSVYIVTKESDYEPEGHFWVFTLRAPNAAALEVAVAELKKLIPQMPEGKAKVAVAYKREEQPVKEIVESINSGRPRLFMSLMLTETHFLSSLKDHLEKLPGVTNLENDFSYNLAECYCEYDIVDFDFRDYHFSVSLNNEAERDVWNFYVNDGKCPEDILTKLVNHCSIFGVRTL